MALAAVTVGELRCENLENPQGIDATQPRLSWKLHSNARDQMQTAYQILVASSQKDLSANKGDLWDSGKISSDQSIQIPYAGKPLAARAECFWKVRVWDQDGKVSDWSKPAQWTIGLLSPRRLGRRKMDRPRWRGRDQLSRQHELDLVSRRRARHIGRARHQLFSPRGDHSRRPHHHQRAFPIHRRQRRPRLDK